MSITIVKEVDIHSRAIGSSMRKTVRGEIKHSRDIYKVLCSQ
jgi:hypothetical protein